MCPNTKCVQIVSKSCPKSVQVIIFCPKSIQTETLLWTTFGLVTGNRQNVSKCISSVQTCVQNDGHILDTLLGNLKCPKCVQIHGHFLYFKCNANMRPKCVYNVSKMCQKFGHILDTIWTHFGHVQTVSKICPQSVQIFRHFLDKCKVKDSETGLHARASGTSERNLT